MTVVRRPLSIIPITMLIMGLLCLSSQASEIQPTTRELFREGAKLWPVYCAQCHNARPGSQFAPYQWDAIIMHMRTQANLPAQDARPILEYLKAGH
jgi:hypothetical protein